MIATVIASKIPHYCHVTVILLLLLSVVLRDSVFVSVIATINFIKLSAFYEDNVNNIPSYYIVFS